MSCGRVTYQAPQPVERQPASNKPAGPGTDDLEKRYEDMQRRQVEFGLKTAEMNARTTELGELLGAISEAARIKS